MKKYERKTKSLSRYATMSLMDGLPQKAEMIPVTEDEWEERIHFGDDRGVGVVELILILVVLIALVAIFKTQLTALVNTILSRITSSANAVMR